jgi:Big-like domain-containing protein
MLFIVDEAGVPSVAKMVTVASVAPPPPPNQPPTVSLTSPPNGATFRSPATISLAATAGDPDGSVVRVEFFRNGTRLAQDTTAPYTFSWNVSATGNHTLTARATDNAGATTTSSPVTVRVRKR